MSVPARAPAFDEAYRTHQTALLRYLERMTRNPAVAADVAHDSWLRLLGAHGRGEALPSAASELRAYLFTVARRAFIDGYHRGHFERRTLRLAPEELAALQLADTGGNGPEHEAERDSSARLIGRALAELPALQREAVVLWRSEIGINAMARRAGVPRDTVLSRKKYAFARLRQRLAGLAPEPGERACLRR